MEHDPTTFSHAAPVRAHLHWSHRLVAQGIIDAATLRAAEQSSRQNGRRIAEVLAAQFGVSALTLTTTQAAAFGCRVIDPLKQPCDPGLVALWGAPRCIRDRVIPWRRIGGAVIVLTSRPEHFARQHSALVLRYGKVRMALTTEHHLDRAVSSVSQSQLILRAENRVPDRLSCRTWNAKLAMVFGCSILAGALLLLVTAPAVLFNVLCLWAIVTLVGNTGLKAAATWVSLFTKPTESNRLPVVPARLPMFTILVPLFKEKAIASHLIARLSKLDYPRELLDICLVVEADDDTTRAALHETRLPHWIRAIPVPAGSLKTKPRAMNYALDFARGSLIGVYDAEDAPAPDQLRQVALTFANRGPKVACLQGVLDFYNAPSNWLTRCFTLEYASWFRVILPGLEKLGFVVPLGGTTLFFRRAVLEDLGAWDAHNVTEDADLGVRLARRGYRTELIATTTLEEANGQYWSWIKQRSRWLKGYAITYGVHMRDLKSLYKDLGFKRFLGVQILFAGTLSQFILAPLLWSFWLIPFGVPHPMAPWLQGPVLYSVMGCFIVSEIVNMIASALGATKAEKRWLWGWIPTLHLYFPLASAAMYKGLWELARNPFYWDKTAHGILVPDAQKITVSPERPISDG